MRGGAIPAAAWGTLLVALLTLNWIWTGDAIQVGTFAYAALAVYTVAALLWALGRDAIRRGPPPPSREPEAVPEASLAAVMIGLSVACVLFGIVWAQFLVFFGTGMVLVSLGRLAVELRSERASRERASRGAAR